MTTMHKTLITAALLYAGTIAALPAHAQDWYMGAAYSDTRGEVDATRISSELVGLGFFSAATASDVRDSGARLYAGRRLLPWLSTEAYYADLGKTQWRSVVTPAGDLAVSIRGKAYGLAALATISPFRDLTVFAKAGLARVESKASFAASGFVDVASTSATERRSSGMYGLGVVYDINRRLAVRLEYDVHTRLGGDTMGGRYDTQAASLGVTLRF
jgi:opacity protein-like surface antigen